MIQRILFLLFAMFSMVCSHAQQNYWGSWKTIYSKNGINADVLFYYSSNSCIDGGKQFKFKTRVIGQLLSNPTYVNWKLEYEDCNGNHFFEEQAIEIGNDLGEYSDGSIPAEYADKMFTANTIVREYYDINISSIPANTSGVVIKPLTPAEIQEKKIWEIAYYNPTIENINEYTRQYPYGKYSKDVSGLLKQIADKKEKEVWETIYYNPSVDNIRAYLNQYPYGKYRTDANVLLETSYYSKADKADNQSSCEIIPTELAVQYWKEYLQLYPSGTYAAYANERLKNYQLKNEKLSIDQQIVMYEEYKNKYVNCASAYDDKVAKLKELSKLISINKKPLILYNILVPGLGNALINRRLVNSGHKPTFKRYFSSLSTLTVWGGMAVAGMYYMQSKDYYKQYTTTKKAAEWDDLLKLSNKKLQTATIWAGAAGAIWALDCLNLVNKQFIVKRKAKKVLESYAFTIVPTPYNTNYYVDIKFAIVK